MTSKIIKGSTEITSATYNAKEYVKVRPKTIAIIAYEYKNKRGY